jgi:hypothetical protein
MLPLDKELSCNASLTILTHNVLPFHNPQYFVTGKEVECYGQLGFLLCQLYNGRKIPYGFLDFFGDDLINWTMNLPLLEEP